MDAEFAKRLAARRERDALIERAFGIAFDKYRPPDDMENFGDPNVSPDTGEKTETTW